MSLGDWNWTTQIYESKDFKDSDLTKDEINNVDEAGYTILHHAIRSSRPDLVYKIASNWYYNLFSEEANEFVFHFAVYFGDLKCIKALWEAMKERKITYNIYLQNRDGNTVIHIAAMQGHIHVLKYFKESLGYDIVHIRNVDNETPYETSRCIDDLHGYRISRYYHSLLQV